MIVATMTEKELFREISSDLLNASKYSQYQDNKFRRLVLKSNKYPVYWDLKYRSPKSNNWLIFFEGRSKKEVGDYGRVVFINYFDSPHGVYAVMPAFTNNRPHLVIYLPHFFSRYANRANVNKSGVELITNYFRYNSSYVYAYHEKMTSEDTFVQEVYGSSKEGVALGLMSVDGSVLFKTFITYEMSKGEQIELFANNEKIRREIHEKP